MLSSTLLIACSANKGNVRPLICPSTAYVDEKDYIIGALETKSDKEFHDKANSAFAGLKGLRIAYRDLRECVDDYNATTSR